MRYLPLALIAAVAAVSCDQQPIEPPANQVAESPAFDFSNGPPVPGNSYIVRDEVGGFVWFFVDSETELGLLVAWDDFDCFDFEGATLLPFQTIFNPSHEGLEMYFESGWLNAHILEPPYECNDVLATGLVHNVWTDNDVYAWMSDTNRSNAWGGHVNGHVGDYWAMWRARCIWGGSTKPDNEAHCNIKTQIH